LCPTSVRLFNKFTYYAPSDEKANVSDELESKKKKAVVPTSGYPTAPAYFSETEKNHNNFSQDASTWLQNQHNANM
jgi:hypothetical protein